MRSEGFSIMVVSLSVAKNYFFLKCENSMQVILGGNGHLTMVIPLVSVFSLFLSFAEVFTGGT